MIEIASLSQAIVSLLTPAIPLLMKAGAVAGTEVSKTIGADSWKQAKAIWGEIWPKLKRKSAAHEAVTDVAQSPDDKDAQAALRLQIKKILAEDEQLVAVLNQLLQADSDSPSGTTVDNSVRVENGGVAFGSGSIVNNTGNITGRDQINISP